MKLLKAILYYVISLSLILATTGCSLFNMPEEDISEISRPPEDSNPDMTEVISMRTDDGIFSINYDCSNTLNPLLCNDSVNMPVTGLIFEGLFKVDNEFNIIPVLCERWNTKDGITFSFQIKSGIKFHDGSELTCNDVVYSLELAAESAPYSGRLKTIENIYEDEDRLYITISDQNMRFPALLDVPIMKYATGDRSNPVGTGPYMYGETSENKYLMAFDGYRDHEKLPIRQIYLKEYAADEQISAFENSYLDLVLTNKSEVGYVEFSEEYERRYIDTTEMHFIGFNQFSDFCASATRRQIISSIIDRDYITKEIITDTSPAVLPVSPASELYFRDVADSVLIERSSIKDYMESAFVEDFDQDGRLEFIKDNDFKKFTLNFIVNKDNLKKVSAAQYIADRLRNYGFDVNLRKLSWEDYEYALKYGIYDIYYGEVKLTSDFDLTELLATSGSVNYGIYDVQLDYLIGEFKKSQGKQMTEKAKELYTYIADNAHIAPLLFEKKLVFSHRGVISNMVPTQNNIFDNITEWEIEINQNEAMS